MISETTSEHPTVSREPRPDAIEAIRAVIADVETAMNTNDSDLGVRHFAADAVATTVRGATTRGWEALAQLHREAFAGPLRDARASYDVVDVTFVRSDVALAHKLAWESDEHGVRRGDRPAMTALYVLVEEDGRWWIAARWNTLIEP